MHLSVMEGENGLQGLIDLPADNKKKKLNVFLGQRKFVLRQI